MRPLLNFLFVPMLAVVCIVASGGACKPRQPEPPSAAEALAARIEALREHLGANPGDTDGWRDLAHLYWLHAEEPDRAVPIFDKLVQKGDSVSRLSRAIIASARSQPRIVAEQTAELLRDAAVPSGQGQGANLAEPATRLLAGVATSFAGADDVIVGLTDAIDETSLPPEAAQRLTSLRGGIERRHGRPFRPYYSAQGCVQNWEVGQVEGHVGTIDLRRQRADDGGFVPDATAVLGALACTVRVHNPVPHSVVRRMQTVFHVTGESFVLELAAQQSMRAYLDGELILATDDSSHVSARHHWFDITTSPGEHELEIHVVIPDTRSWVLARATDPRGQAIAARAGGLETGPTGATTVERRVAEFPAAGVLATDIYDPLRDYLRLEDALADGDDYRAGHVFRRAQSWNFAAGQLLVAEFHERDGTRPRALRIADAQQAYQAALESDPAADRARAAVLEMQMGRGEAELVVKALEKLPKGRLDSVAGDLLRARVYLERGSDFLAEAALKDAARRDPKSCAMLMARRQLAMRREQVALVDELTGQLRRCAGALGLRARWAIERGNLELARKLWTTKLTRSPDDVEVLESLSEIAVASRDYDEAARLHAQILNVAPYRLSSHVAQADLLAHAGAHQLARTELGRALQRLPHISRLREMGRGLGLHDDLWAHRVDASDVIAEYRAADVDYEGAGEVLVLDRDVARVYESGGQRHIVHQVVHLLSKSALDNYGELVPPQNASVLTLHSIKPDGTVLEPELVPGKDGLSLRHLEIGDLVEYEYLIDVDPIPAVPGYVDLSRFRFQSLDVPYHLSELVVLHPEAMSVVVESRNGAPAPVQTEHDGLRRLSFRADRMPRRGPEPNHRSLIDELPMVRAHTKLSLVAWLDLLSERLWTAQQANADLEARARSLTKNHKRDRDKLRALWLWVMENVDEDGDLSTPATRTLAQRRGDRLMLLRSMLNVIGMRSQLWLVRDKFGPKHVEGGHPMPEVYDSPALAVWLKGAREPVVVMTLSRNMPLGYLAPAHSASDALQVWLADGDEPSGRVRTPAVPAHLQNRRAYALELSVDERGQGVLAGSITLHGLEAIQWREILEEVDVDRVAEVFQQSELGPLLPGAALDLDHVDVDHAEDTDAPLVLNFRAKANGVGVNQAGELAIPSMLVPMNQGLGFTRLPSRWSGLLIQYAPELEARVAIELVGARFTAMPPTESMHSAYGSYERKIEGGGVGQEKVVLWTRSTLNEGIVEAELYRELATFTQGVAAAERAVLRAR